MSTMIKNRYMVVRKLGEGGMADVFLAMDTLLNREVAIKILRGELSLDPINLLRFKREANAASALNHPNIVEIYDIGEEDGQHFIVMEVIRGKTLKQLIHQRGAMDVDEALVIMKQMIAGVSQAHKNNIIHRDIKPQNVLIKDDGTVKIADFGIATAQDATQLTQTDSVMGSVHYMAPEVARGEAASIQSDIYSLGIVFYELLTGQVPHSGDAPVQIAIKHMREEIPSVREFNSSIPQSIENAIIKATVKNKFFRYKNTDELLHDLETSLDEARKNEKPIAFDLERDNSKTIAIDQITDFDEDKEKSSPLLTILVTFVVAGAAIASLLWLLNVFNDNQVNKTVIMPDINGLTYAQARDTLEEMGLFLSTSVRYQLTDDVEFGKIINFTPTANTEVAIGSTVNVWVSDGMYFVVEDYKFMTLEEVTNKLANTRVTIRVEKEANTDFAAGTVIRQELLNPNDRLDPRRVYEIKLVVSSYVELIIPQLIGTNVLTAKEQLEASGVNVVLVQRNVDDLSEAEKRNVQYDVVVSMSPNPGSLYIQYEDTEVILYYY